MQVPPQLISVPGHDTAHAPLAQTLPCAQTAPALPFAATPQPVVAPQYPGLVAGSMHSPPQLISVPGQETAQVPLAQTFPFAQTAPTLPWPLMPQPSVAPQ